jgi:ribosome-binding protein aMBF1 (putative translation factor)
MPREVRESAARYLPVDFDPKRYKARRSKVDPAFARASRALDDEFAALDVLLDARRAAGLSQAEVARRMGVKPSALARIESSLVSRKHSPTLVTLRRYAEACGKRLVIAIE